MLSYSHIFPSHTGNVHITVIESPPELPWANQISTAYELGDPARAKTLWSARWESSIKARQLEHGEQSV